MRDAALAAEVRFFKTRRPEPPRFWQPKQLWYGRHIQPWTAGKPYLRG